MTNSKPSPRIEAIVNALPLREGMRVLEIGCGPGVAARAVADRIGNGHILAIDRSKKAIGLAEKNSPSYIRNGRCQFRQIAIEDLHHVPEEEKFDLAFAIRVGALDGRHPKAGEIALQRIAAALKKNGRLFIDGGDPIREVDLADHR